jgi:hypothetical protein
VERRKSNLKNSSTTLKQLLVNYDCTFKRDLDEMWIEYDIDQNGFLDKKEALNFLDEVAQIIDL